MKKAVPFIFCFLLQTLLGHSQLTPEWVRHFGNNPLIEYVLNDMVVDKGGNIYIAGYGEDTSNNTTGIILKYSSSGVLLWVDSIPATGYYLKLAIDKEQNILLCTAVRDSLTDIDFLTIKYNPQGDTIWTERFSGPGSNVDYPVAITVDDSSNVYVTGKVTTDPSAGFATIKYSPDGALQWIAEYLTGYSADAANAIAIDSLYNVYITGEARDSSQMVTIKYNSAGVQQWCKKYNYGWGLFMEIFDNQYVYAGGYIDSFSGSRYYLVIKYDLNGNEIWSAKYNSQDSLGQSYIGQNNPLDMKVDKNGSVIMAGSEDAYTANMGYSTVKFSADGAVQWAKSYRGGAAEGWNSVNSLVIDNSGKVYVTGYSQDTIDGGDVLIVTIIYDSTGNTVNVIKFLAQLTEDNQAARIALDTLGDIYIATSTFVNDSILIKDLAVIKYGAISHVRPVNNPNDFFLFIYPNPFTNEAIANYSLPAETNNATLTVYDLLGRECDAYKLPKAETQITIDAKKLCPGIYFYSLMVNGKVMDTKKMVVE